MPAGRFGGGGGFALGGEAGGEIFRAADFVLMAGAREDGLLAAEFLRGVALGSGAGQQGGTIRFGVGIQTAGRPETVRAAAIRETITHG